MAPLPSTSDFASFQELQCSSAIDKQNCIWYLPVDKRRCGYPLNKQDRNEAFQLRAAILRSVPHELPLQHLKEYARLKCCNYGHRLQLIEHDLIESLAQRWQRELSPEPNLLQHIQALPSPLAVSEPNTAHEPDLHGETTPNIIQTRLRSRQGTQTETTPIWTNSTDTISPEFRPYKRAGAKSVSSRLITPLTPRSKTGSIYLYTRVSSPGYVKIGYSCNVQSRLNSWQRSCGYKPILLAAFDDVPHMRRVESLIHHQLAEVWRTERRCQKCCREHQEWFEIEKEDAIKVAGQWAEWMKQAQPYGIRGYLKGIWVDELERLETRGSPVTAEALLSAHSRLLLEQEVNTIEEVKEVDNTPQNVTHSSLFTDDLTAEPDTDLHRTQDVGSFLVGMLNLMHGFDRSLQCMRQASMTGDAIRRARTDQAYTMVSPPATFRRQDTSATVASEA